MNVRLRVTLFVAAVIALIAAPAMTRADSAQSGQHPFQLSVGAYSPINHDTQQFIHTVYKIKGIYDFDQRIGTAAPVSMYGEYGWGSHSPASGANVNYQQWALGVEARTPSQTYGGVGVGYYGQSGTLSVSGQAAQAHHVGVGGAVFIGTDFSAPHQGRVSPGLGVRLGYSFLPNFQGLNTNAWDFGMTYRL